MVEEIVKKIVYAIWVLFSALAVVGSLQRIYYSNNYYNLEFISYAIIGVLFSLTGGLCLGKLIKKKKSRR